MKHADQLIKRILFLPKIDSGDFSKFHVMNSWGEFPNILNGLKIITSIPNFSP